MSDKINLTLNVWRQKSPKSAGKFEAYDVKNVDVNSSFLEMIDVLNEDLTKKGQDPIEFDHDCREGICGTCGAMVNGRPHGPLKNTTLCQLHMREFKNNETITIEPFRSTSLPIVKDLVVDRSAFDNIIKSGGFISAKTGSGQDANAILIPKSDADDAFNSAQCIGCSACVAACPNASAMLFVAAKVNHLAKLPQGQAERKSRVKSMVLAMDKSGFGNCSNAYECEAACPKGISVANIASMNKDFMKAGIFS